MKRFAKMKAGTKANGLSPNHHPLHGRSRDKAKRARSKPLIAVFGSSQVRHGDALYAQGLEMGDLLGRSGFDVMTGGYKGVMEAVSRGARAAGAHVVGITMAIFKDRVNRFVMDEIHTANFYERFGWLVERADGYIAMGGGTGTLAEVTFTWQELQLGMIPRRPLVLVGPEWRALYASWVKNLVPMRDMYKPLTLVETPKNAAEFMCNCFGLARAAEAATREQASHQREHD
jgi:uncharacterized protein (TIGR00730 family)